MTVSVAKIDSRLSVAMDGKGPVLHFWVKPPSFPSPGPQVLTPAPGSSLGSEFTAQDRHTDGSELAAVGVPLTTAQLASAERLSRTLRKYGPMAVGIGSEAVSAAGDLEKLLHPAWTSEATLPIAGIAVLTSGAELATAFANDDQRLKFICGVQLGANCSELVLTGAEQIAGISGLPALHGILLVLRFASGVAKICWLSREGKPQ